MPVISYLATDTESEPVPFFSDLHNLTSLSSISLLSSYIPGDKEVGFEADNLLLHRVIPSVLDPRKCEYLEDYSLDFE
jgi:hypothetical protein